MRRGFTLVELLVVILVIVVLIGLLLPGIAMVRQAQARNVTLKLLEEIAHITTDQLGREGILPASYASNTLAIYLVDEPKAANQSVRLELQKQQRNADAVLDAWGSPVQVTVDRDTNLGQSYVRRIELRSRGRKSAASDTADDLVFVYETDVANERAVFRLVQ